MNSILANTGVPMLFLALPPMIVLIIPVIFIEFLAARGFVMQETAWRKWLGITLANLFSTFIGWPVAWGILVLLQIVTGGGHAYGLESPIGVIFSVTHQAAWLIPYEEDLFWMIPAPMLVLLIPFFLTSVYSERLVLKWLWKHTDRQEIVRLSWLVHCYSCAFLFVVVLIYGAFMISSK